LDYFITYPFYLSETDHQAIRLEREKEITQQINTDCQLDCAADSNLDQVIDKIKKLISVPGGECLTMIIQLEKETMGELLSPQLFTTPMFLDIFLPPLLSGWKSKSYKFPLEQDY